MGIVNQTIYHEPKRILRSLPLMGIVNEEGRCQNDGNTQLITPHGDRKRLSVFMVKTQGEASLPLMGIVNFRWPWWPRPGKSSHYPSWGS